MKKTKKEIKELDLQNLSIQIENQKRRKRELTQDYEKKLEEVEAELEVLHTRFEAMDKLEA